MTTPDSSRFGVLLDLTGTFQSLANSRRSGELEISHGGTVRRFRFAQGQLVGMSGFRPKLLPRALCWAGVCTRQWIDGITQGLTGGAAPEDLIRHLMDSRQLPNDALLDGIDCLVEEDFTQVVSWQAPSIDFRDSQSNDPWLDLQQKLGLSISPSALLLESLRRQDELVAVHELIPNTWDTLIRVPELALPGNLSPDAQAVLADWTDAIPCGSYFEAWNLPPFRARLAIAELRRTGLIRPSTSAELVIQADAVRQAGALQMAFGLYRRALQLGQESPRIHLQIAELAEHFGYTELAADSHVAAAGLLGDSGAAVHALRNAIRLGADPVGPLTQLVALHLAGNRREDAIRELIALASEYEKRHNLEQAIQAMREAQELGADAAVSGPTLGRLFVAMGDQEQAATQLEQAARALHEQDRLPEAIDAWRELLRLRPERLDYARECAELLLWNGEKAECLTMLREGIASKLPASEELKLSMHELLAKLDPNDVTVHDWLAKAYSRRRDRQGATAQLRLAAQAQEKSGDDLALATTLERILEMDPRQGDILSWLADVRLRLHQDPMSADCFARAHDVLLEQGNRREARALMDKAVERLPSAWQLRLRIAELLLRDGDRGGAARHFFATHDLARSMGESNAAREALIQLTRLRPDDVIVRFRLATLAEELHDPQSDHLVVEALRTAARTHNLGLALDLAKRRVVQSPSFEARSELIELLRRVGDHQGELLAGNDLVSDLLSTSDFPRAVEVLSRLVASNPRNADLVLQLAEVQHSLNDVRQALRCYRHAVVLLQQENRLGDAKDVLDQIGQLSDEQEVLLEVRNRLERNVPVDWERIRQDMKLGRTTGVHAASSGTSSIRRISSATRATRVQNAVHPGVGSPAFQPPTMNIERNKDK